VETFVGPGLACESFCRCGVDKTKIQQVYPGAKMQVSDLVIHGTFAMPTDDSDLNHMGYVLAVKKVRAFTSRAIPTTAICWHTSGSLNLTS
jgi:hypothetical protein